jgi:hypothetical protein
VLALVESEAIVVVAVLDDEIRDVGAGVGDTHVRALGKWIWSVVDETLRGPTDEEGEISSSEWVLVAEENCVEEGIPDEEELEDVREKDGARVVSLKLFKSVEFDETKSEGTEGSVEVDVDDVVSRLASSFGNRAKRLSAPLDLVFTIPKSPGLLLGGE